MIVFQGHQHYIKLMTVMWMVILVRLGLVLVPLNYEYPDEYWQGPEIAYEMVYGYGFRSWEWTMEEPLRSPLYPLYLSLGYRGAATVLPGSDWALQLAPKLMQALIAMLADIFLIKTMETYFGRLQPMELAIVLTNWFYLLSMQRTYVNSLEAALTITAFYFWTKRRSGCNDLISRVCVAILYVARPTSLIVWAVVWPYELLTLASGHVRFILKNGLSLVVMVLLSFVLSSYWYSRAVLTEWNFIKYNIVLKWSQLYGANSFMYYLLISLPLILGPLMVPFLAALLHWRHLSVDIKALIGMTGATLLVLSLSVHKEHRFLMAILPFLLVIAYQGVLILRSRAFLGLCVVVNLFMMYTISLSGKTGGFSLLTDLRRDIKNSTQKVNIVYMCEPHGLPAYSYLLREAQFVLPDSSPMAKIAGRDQSELLEKQQATLYGQLTSELSTGPEYIVMQSKHMHSENNRQFQQQVASNYRQLGSDYGNSIVWETIWNQPDSFVLLARRE